MSSLPGTELDDFAGVAPEGGRRSDRNESQTVLRACDVLKAFQFRGEEISLLDVIGQTGLPKPRRFSCCGR